MSEQKWEYCELCLNGWEKKGNGTLYDVWVRYYSPTTSARYTLAETEGKNAKVWSYNPFTKAFCILGEAGWELVSHQFGVTGGGAYLFRMDWSSRGAIFKRPVQFGMSADEPKLIDLVKP